MHLGFLPSFSIKSLQAADLATLPVQSFPHMQDAGVPASGTAEFVATSMADCDSRARACLAAGSYKEAAEHFS